jgi:hypothetical protein
MNPLVSPTPSPHDENKYFMPAGWQPNDFHDLATTPMDAVEQPEIERIDKYCTTWLASLAPNQPIRPDVNEFNPWICEIGYVKFSEAETAWRQLFPVIAPAS